MRPFVANKAWQLEDKTKFLARATERMLSAVLDEAGREAPVYPVDPRSISILRSPDEFYHTLLTGIKESQQRVLLAALYLGPGEKEQALAAALQEKAGRVRMSLLFDGNRGRRGMPCTAQLLHGLDPHLYEHPALPGWLSRWLPWRWREVAGISHMKFAVFDDAVLLTGANLSQDYFTNRADRYLLIRNRPLADYYEGQLLAGLKGKGEAACFKSGLQSKAISSTFVIPTVDWPTHGLRQETMVLQRMLSFNWHRGHLATAYLNPTTNFLQQLPAVWPILTAAPTANGFHGSTGLTSHIPLLYRHCALELQAAGRRVWEYCRPGWTFHAKGLWLEHDDLLVTAIGSSNYGHRSQQRDLENQAWIVTTDPLLRDAFRQERETLFAEAKEIKENDSSHWLYPLLHPLAKFLL